MGGRETLHNKAPQSSELLNAAAQTGFVAAAEVIDRVNLHIIVQNIAGVMR